MSSRDLIPGARSTPEATSTPAAPLAASARATFSGRMPPATSTGEEAADATGRACAQSHAAPVPP